MNFVAELLPTLLYTAREILNDPVLLNTCVGFCDVTTADPSPKVHFHVFGIFVLVSANFIVTPFFTAVGEKVKEATGDFVGLLALTVTDFVAVALPAVFPAVNVTVYVFAVVYLCVTLLPEPVPPSPKFQVHIVGVLVLVSVNV